MKVTGCYSRNWIESFTSPPPYSSLICVRNPGSDPPKIKGSWADVLFLEYWDVDEVQQIPIVGGGLEVVEPASEAQMDAVYHFIADHQYCNVFASCEAGISRSGGIREFLERHGWTLFVQQRDWPISPHIHMLNGLNKRQREQGLIETYTGEKPE
jgi:hypothetical protein